MTHSEGNNPLRVLIAGGGIAGLTAAIALCLQGHDVQVFEQSSLLRHTTASGNAVFCAPNCTVLLNRLGIDLAQERGLAYGGAKFLDSDCDVLHFERTSDEQRASWIAEWYLISRVDLHNALRRTALERGVKIHTSASIQSIDPEKATMTIAADLPRSHELDNNSNNNNNHTHTQSTSSNNSNGTSTTTIPGTLIIGADGVHSATRTHIVRTPSHEAPTVFSSGACCYRFLIPTATLQNNPITSIFVEKPQGVFVHCAGEDRRLVMYPCSLGETMNCVAIVPTAEVGEIKRGRTDYDQVANKMQLKAHFAHFAQPIQQLLDMVPDDGIRLYDLFDMEDLPSLIRDKAVLIGDAGHPFQPHIGQGAAQAIEDACALGVVMSRDATPESVPARLQLWQSLRKERVSKVMALTRARKQPAYWNKTQPKGDKGLAEAYAYCIHHNAWTNAEEQLKAWEGGKVAARGSS
ncbi:hypothetical protein BD289DRAFT_456675 [Coniella lustricola]|uniref:Uncharacterized protein n=1 Tax=Coniella lustricola TaxID=2025994 RepID=A0A2T2ZV06_9PEZI|nr:hypothetical protein BD289DRAFT_456675 [Coniella lustricola]